MVDDLPDGVYLNLGHDAYFAQNRLGSSDFIKIYKTGAGWWWSSKFNVLNAPKKSREMTYGSALHSLMLEGSAAYRRSFAVMPDKAKLDGLCETIPQMKAALESAGIDTKGTSKWAKPDWAAAMHANIPHVPCWINIEEDFRAYAGERQVISAPDDRMLQLMRDIAIDPTRPDNMSIRRLLIETEEHPALVEVSIFATVDGLRRRWRIDRLYPAVDLDLKSLGAWRGRPLRFEVGEVLARNGWDIQRSDYFNGRMVAHELVRQGKLFGGSVEQRRYLQKIVADELSVDWIWLCYQKPSPAGLAPVIFPLWDSSWATNASTGELIPGVIRTYGQHKLDKAIAFYKRMVAEFGLEKPWAHVEELHYTDDALEPHVTMPHWIAEDAPTDAEAYPEVERTVE